MKDDNLRRSNTVYLAFGLQSGGTTLISYCFLQRADVAGVLDWFHDRLPDLPPREGRANYWCKCTIASFRAREVIEYFQDQGYKVRAVLIVRDVRRAYDSLIGRTYGRNGTTAEDPPLRTRFRRFLEDWEFFRRTGLPIMALESFMRDPEMELQRVCDEMRLPWDQGMVSWPFDPSEVWDGKGGNQGFVDGIERDLVSSLRPQLVERKLQKIPLEDLDWIDRTFAEFNAVQGYPEHLPDELLLDLPKHALRPQLENSGRYRAMVLKRTIHRALPGLQILRRRLNRDRT